MSDATAEASNDSTVDAVAEADGSPEVSAGPEGGDAVSESDVSTGDTGLADQSSESSGTLGDAETTQCNQCPTGEKLCYGACATAQDPQTGCAQGCSACSVLSHASSACTPQGTCTIGTCDPGWADCNGNPADGCEADLSSAATCNSCTNACSGATALCSAGGCVAACTPPQTLCTDRCADLVSDPHSCGGCGHACNVYPWTCSAGQCAGGCPPGETACGQSCVNTSVSVTNCGGCSMQCLSSPLSNPITSCQGGSCVYDCQPGWTVCSGTCVVTSSDPANCGTCGHACAAGQVCTGGSCSSSNVRWLSTGLAGPTEIALDTTTVYWADDTDGSIRSVPKGGGSVSVLAQNQAKPMGLAVDGSYVYWGANLGGAIWRAPSSGQGVPSLVATASQPTSIALSGSNVYWTGSQSSSVWYAPKTGGTAAAFWTESVTSGAPTLVLANSSALFVFDDSLTVYQIPLSTGVATILSSGGINLLAVDDSRWCGSGGMNIHSIGCTPPEWGFCTDPKGACPLYTTPVPKAIAINSCSIGWTDGATLNVAPFGAEYSTPLSAGTVQPKHLAMDANRLYWTDATAVGAIPLP